MYAFQGELAGGGGGSSEWLLLGSPLLFQDRMMSGCDTVTGEHSYSSQQDATVGSQSAEDTAHQFVLPDIKMEEEDLDSDIFSAVPVATATGQTDLRPKEIKEENPQKPSAPRVSPLSTAAPVGRIMSASSVKRKATRASVSSLHSAASKPNSCIGVDSHVSQVVGQGRTPALNSASTSVLKTVVSVASSGTAPAPSSCVHSGASTPTIGPLRVKLEPGRF
ncbi:cyclic AMP-responsive element-binding protein 3 protein 2-like, partial [Tropilaelaps mercedesae]